MKNTYLYLLLLSTLNMFFVSCNETGVERPLSPDAELSRTEFVVSSDAVQLETLLTTTSDEWNVEGEAEWCTVSPKSGNSSATIKIDLQENNTYDDRECQWLVAAENREATQTQKKIITLRIVQKAKGANDESSEDLKMLSFTFLRANNPKLTSDIALESITTGHEVDTIRLITSDLVLDLKLKATFTHNATSVKSSLGEVLSATTTLDYALVQDFVLSKGSTIKKYVVILHQFTGLPVVYVNTENGAPIVSKDDYLRANVRFVENLKDGSHTLLDVPTQIKGRGNSTWTQPKKPYKLKLNAKASVLGFPSDKEWVLLANYLDPSLLRNDIAFQVASRMKGLAYTPNRKFVELVLNGRHNGSYLLTEQIKISSSRVNVEEMKETDVSPDKISGGYLLEFDTYYDEVWKFKSPIRNLPVMVKEPDITQTHLDWLIGYFTEVENTIYGPNFKDPINGYAKYIDVDSWIDWWIVYETMGNYEPNHPKSVYMHKKRNGKLVMGPVWDFDWIAFNNKTDRFYMKGEPNRVGMPLYYERLLEDPAFKARLKDRYRELRRNELSDLNLYMTSRKVTLHASVVSNYKLWPVGSADYGVEFNKQYNFIVNHLKWLDSNIPLL